MCTSIFSKKHMLLVLLLFCDAVLGSGNNLDPHSRAVEMLSKMTLDEKISLLHGTHGDYVGNVAGIERLGIPALKMNDGPQGFRTTSANLHGTTTAFPSGLNIGASFDPDVAYKWGAAMGKEFLGKGANIQLGPGMNVARVPLNGRNFEYVSGEDPILGQIMVAPVVRGIQDQGIIANAKHFLNNNEEKDRYLVSEVVDERTEWEIYLPPFVGAINAGVLSVMCSYNRINGVWVCENEETLNQILKKKLGFSGWVMSDWGATHSTVKAALAGLDQQMPGSEFFGFGLHAAIKLKEIPEDIVNDKVLRILTPMYAIGLFDRSTQEGNINANVTSPEHNAIAREIAAKSTVLLRNENDLLPLSTKSIRKIAVLGTAAQDKPIIGGHGSGSVVPAYISTGYQGILDQVQGQGVSVEYHPTSPLQDAVQAAQNADVAVVFVATVSGEGFDRKSLSLDANEDELVSSVAKVQPNTVVVVTCPGAVLMPWSEDVSAILMNFLPGQEAGNAVADILFGNVNPSARLPLTMPNIENEVSFTPEQYPGLPTFLPLKAVYSEKLQVGYRWYHAHDVLPKYCFGHGLSYTSFNYSNLVVDERSVSIQVTNVGNVAGSDAPQLYITYPSSETDEPPRQLRDFVRTQVLEPGQSSTATFSLVSSPQAFSIWDVSVHDWKLVHGDFGIEIGASSCNIQLKTEMHI